MHANFQMIVRGTINNSGDTHTGRPNKHYSTVLIDLSLLLRVVTDLLEIPEAPRDEDVLAVGHGRIRESRGRLSLDGFEFAGVEGGSRPFRLWLDFSSSSSLLSGALGLRRFLLATESG